MVLALLSSGGATSMQISTEDLNRLTPTEGIVVGSVQIKGGKDILGRTGGSRGGAEEVFVAKMEADDYR